MSAGAPDDAQCADLDEGAFSRPGTRGGVVCCVQAGPSVGPCTWSLFCGCAGAGVWKLTCRALRTGTDWDLGGLDESDVMAGLEASGLIQPTAAPEARTATQPQGDDDGAGAVAGVGLVAPTAAASDLLASEATTRLKPPTRHPSTERTKRKKRARQSEKLSRREKRAKQTNQFSTPNIDESVTSLFIDLIKSGRILTTSCFSGVPQHYLRQNGAFVPCSKVETVALFENHFGMDVPLEATGRLSTAMKQYMTHKLGGASINTSEQQVQSMRNAARMALAFEDGVSLVFNGKGGCKLQETTDGLVLFTGEVAAALSPGSKDALRAVVANPCVLPPAAREFVALVRAIIGNDALTDQLLTLEAHTLAGLDDAAKWCVNAFGEKRDVGKTLILSMFNIVAGTVFFRRIADNHRSAFTADGTGGVQVATAAQKAYGSARKLLLDEISTSNVRANWDTIKLWQNAYQVFHSPWRTGGPLVLRATRVDVSGNYIDPNNAFKGSIALEDKRGILCVKISDPGEPEAVTAQRVLRARELSAWLRGEGSRTLDEVRLALLAVIVHYASGKRIPDRNQPHDWFTLDKYEKDTPEAQMRVWFAQNEALFTRGTESDRVYPARVFKRAGIALGTGGAALKRPYEALHELMWAKFGHATDGDVPLGDRKDTNNMVYISGVRMAD